MSPGLPGGFEKQVIGYCNPLSVRPGQAIDFMLSSHTPGPAELSVVELISGDDRPHGTGLVERTVDCGIPDQVVISTQPLVTGSYARIAGMPGVTRGEFAVWVYPTLVDGAGQTIANLAGTILSVGARGFSATWTGGTVGVDVRVQTRRWYRLRFIFGAETVLDVERMPSGTADQPQRWREEVPEVTQLSAGEWFFAATDEGQHCFNGRLEAPVLTSDGREVAAWDFATDMARQCVVDRVGGYRAELFQTPTRAVGGVRWDGSEQNYLAAPGHYGAMHFHEDDLTDAGWSSTVSWVVPQSLRSGQYALKVVQGQSDDYIPFFVRPPAGTRTSDLVYLVPTATYLAYANQRISFAEGDLAGIMGEPKLRHANEAYTYAHPEVGFSLYEHHRDGSGVHFSSRLRPVLNLKPKTATWAFNADTHITAWLDAIEQPFDVVTDEDLHVEGVAALKGYRAVVTGTHPEYYSTSMRNSLAAWLRDGGRLMYMGGNGFYWRIAYAPDNPAIIEVRRAEDGTRAWIAEPGEYYQQFNGEYGGLWRRLGKPPNELVGIGFAAQGFDGGTYYRVQPGALDPRVGFIVAGLEGNDTWGNAGNQGGGAAGEEIDRWDPKLGSPEHAVVIASSEDHRPGMLRVKEEFHMTRPLGNDPKVRADMVFFEVPGGGAVFSTGSISYAGSLAHNNYTNDIATITGNVLARFLEAKPFDYPG